MTQTVCSCPVINSSTTRGVHVENLRLQADASADLPPRPLRSLESAAAAAFSSFSQADPPSDQSASPSSTESNRFRPALLPRFESQPLRQNSEPPQPDPEPIEDTQTQISPSHEKRLSRFAPAAAAESLSIGGFDTAVGQREQTGDELPASGWRDGPGKLC